MLAYQVALADVVYCEGMGFMVYKPVVYSTADLFTPASIAVEVRMVNKDNITIAIDPRKCRPITNEERSKYAEAIAKVQEHAIVTCLICGSRSRVTEYAPCRHLKLEVKCQLPTCREQDPHACVGCPDRRPNFI